jgi:hypothetical protein
MDIETSFSFDDHLDKLFDACDDEYFDITDETINDGNKVINVKDLTKKQYINYCSNCGIPMEIKMETDEYFCVECKMVKPCVGGCLTDESTNDSSLRISSTNGHNYYFNSGDLVKQTKKKISDFINQCIENANKFNIQIDEDCLRESGIIYYDIYNSNDDEKINSKLSGPGKRLIAGIYYHMCLGKKIAVKEIDVLKFMNLSIPKNNKTNKVIRQLKEEGKIDIDIVEDRTSIDVKKSLRQLGLNDEEYEKFVLEFIDISEKNRFESQRRMNTKIASGIWILISSKKIQISKDAVSKATECTSSTFIKLCETTTIKKEIFQPLYDKFKLIPINSFRREKKN